MILTDILSEPGYKVVRKEIREAVEEILTEKGIKGDIEVTVSIIGESRMKELHKQFMKTEEVTDVLSFPLYDSLISPDLPKPDPDGVLRLGDVVVCYPQAERQAEENGRSVDEEIKFLVGHGCLHLLGIHHEE